MDQLLNNTFILENEKQNQVNLINQFPQHQQQNQHLKQQQQQRQQQPQLQKLYSQKESQSGLVESKKNGTKIKGTTQHKSQFNQDIKDKFTLKIS